MIKAGRYSAAILLITVGVLLIVDQTFGSDYLSSIFIWWPLLLISIGLEYLILASIYQKSEKAMKLDIAGLLLVVVISIVAIGFTSSSTLTDRFMKQIEGWSWENINFGGLASENGLRFDRGTSTIPMKEGLQDVKLTNEYGKVMVRSADVQQIEVNTIVYVDKVTAAEAETIANQTSVHSSDNGSELIIETKVEKYNNASRKPRMNLIITVPMNSSLNWEFYLKNSELDIQNIPLTEQLYAETTNARILIEQLAGNIKLKTSNAIIKVTKVHGDVEVRTTNAFIDIQEITGEIDVHTTNGKITVKEAKGELNARTTNGAIYASTSSLKGDWILHTTNGIVEATLPADSNFTLNAQGSSTSSDFPMTLSKDKKTMTGKVGSGEYQIKMETTNGEVTLKR